MPLSVLPPASYPALFSQASKLRLHTMPAAQLPALSWVLHQASGVQLAGAAVFLAGNALQWHSHWLMARLAGRGRTPGYKIPKGELASCLSTRLCLAGSTPCQYTHTQLHDGGVARGLPPGSAWAAHCTHHCKACKTMRTLMAARAGGAFELVSCPHYLGEVVIYAGLVLVEAGRRTTAWLMLLWVVSSSWWWYHWRCCLYATLRAFLFCTALPCAPMWQRGWSQLDQARTCMALLTASRRGGWPSTAERNCLCLQVTNLSLAARMTHAWYKQQFKTYPKGRRALFPSLY